MVGLTPEDRLCFPFSFGPFIGFWAAFEGANRLGNLCLGGGGMSSQQRLSLIADNQATVLCCTPTYALRLAEVAAEQGTDLATGSVRMLIVAGEPGGSIPSIRSRIESAWGARVIDHWGMTEIGALGVECAENPGGLHILESECIAEIVDPETLEPASSDAHGVRRGELVITNLGRLGSPLIRYRTGDLVESDPEPCACGRALLRLKGGILGRADDMITIRGNNVFPSSVEAILREFDQLIEFRIEVRTERSMHQILFQLEPRPELSDTEASDLASRVKNTIKDRLNFHPEVQLVEPNSLPRFELKGRRFFRVSDES
jgi:phenylacetate-CoA ligase